MPATTLWASHLTSRHAGYTPEGTLVSESTMPPAQESFGSASASESFGSAPGSGSFGSAPAAGPVPAAPEPAKKKSRGPIFSIVVVVLVLIAGVAVYLLNKNNVTNAKVGDCMPASVADNGSDISQTKTVACTSADAKYKVVGVVDNQDEPSADSTVFETVCQPYSATVGLWVGPSNGKGGKIYCLTDK
jgi:hypothetical protein